MSLVHLSGVCSHLQNVSRARLGLTSIPFTNLHLALSQQLQKSGFVSTVTVGDNRPPEVSPVLTAETDSPRGVGGNDGDGGKSRRPLVTKQNVGTRRIWLGMKYYNNDPVIGKMWMESKPTRRIWLGVQELADVARGKQSGYVKGIRGIGECMYVSTDRGIMEIRECVERKIGGMVLCRVM